MLNFDKLIPRTDREKREQLKLDRFQQYENLRKIRFFNAKNRLIGKDNEGLAKQIEEQKLLKALEDEKEKAFLEKEAAELQIANSLQETVDRVRKEHARDINVYRLTEQVKEKRREFDLNDPKEITNQMPMRLQDLDVPDPREETMSSFLKFSSEDYTGEKLKAKKKHLWQSLAKQIADDRMRRRNAEIEHLTSGQDAIHLDALMMKLEENFEKAQADAMKATMAYNQRKADFEREKRELEKKKDYEDSMAHINTCKQSEFYSEGRSEQKGWTGLNMIRPKYYRGMTDEEIKDIQKYQIKQAEEKREQKKAEKALEDYWSIDEDMMTRAKHIREGIDEATRKQICQQIFQENMKLAAIQQIQRDQAKRLATDNFPTEEFYACFNASTR